MDISCKAGLTSLGIDDSDEINKALQTLIKKNDYFLAATHLQQHPDTLNLVTRSMLADALVSASKKPAHRPPAFGRTKTDERNDRIKAEIEDLISGGTPRKVAYTTVQEKYGLTIEAFAKARKGSQQAQRLAAKLSFQEKK